MGIDDDGDGYGNECDEYPNDAIRDNVSRLVSLAETFRWIKY